MPEILFERLVLVWIVVAIGSFIYLLFKPAPYGRHAKKGWGVLLNSRLAWILMESPVFIVMGSYLLFNFHSIGDAGKVLMLLFLLHYFNRCFIYPFRLRSSDKKMPLAIVLSAIFFNLVNGNVLGYYFISGGSIQLDSLSFLVGGVLFLVGLLINISSDEILIKLRRASGGYAIPQGGFYKFVSCPNYFGEMLEWLGFAVAAGHLGAWSFFIWTFANLFPRALANHKWYKREFPVYPQERKAVIPYII